MECKKFHRNVINELESEVKYPIPSLSQILKIAFFPSQCSIRISKYINEVHK